MVLRLASGVKQPMTILFIPWHRMGMIVLVLCPEHGGSSPIRKTACLAKARKLTRSGSVEARRFGEVWRFARPFEEYILEAPRIC